VKPWTVQNGVLTLTADHAAPAIQPLINGYKFTSAMLTTHKSFAQLYGYFEIRAQMPCGQNMWPAGWLMPVNDTWPPEIDIFECMGQYPTMLDTTVHSGLTGTDVFKNAVTMGADVTKAMHVYGCDWRADFVTFFFDDKMVFQTPTPTDYTKAMYVILNLGIFGPGFVPGIFPQKFMVDYVHVYK